MRVLRETATTTTIEHAAMGIGFREYLVVDDDSLMRLTNRSFERMLHSPEKYRFSQFGGQRIRSASVIIEFKDRKPVQVLRTTFDILTFDQHGALDYQQFLAHQAARMEDLVLDMNVEGNDAAKGLIDAKRRFISQGGKWTPSRAMEKKIGEAALNRVKVPLIKPTLRVVLA